MANVFAILSAIALAAACFLAMKNKEAYQTEIELRKQEQDRWAKLDAEHKQLIADYDAMYKERTDLEKENVGHRDTLSSENKKNSTLEGEKTAKSSEQEANAKKIADIESQLQEIGPIQELARTISELKESLEGLTLDIASSEAKVADLTNEKGRTEGVIANFNKKNSDYANKRSFFASTRISAIYPAYGFVTLPIGNTSGVVPNSTLEVQRDGAVVAKLRVRSVESGRAAAEIIPDSLAQDTTLMVGDRVVPGAETTPAGPAAR